MATFDYSFSHVKTLIAHGTGLGGGSLKFKWRKTVIIMSKGEFISVVNIMLARISLILDAPRKRRMESIIIFELPRVQMKVYESPSGRRRSIGLFENTGLHIPFTSPELSDFVSQINKITYVLNYIPKQYQIQIANRADDEKENIPPPQPPPPPQPSTDAATGRLPIRDISNTTPKDPQSSTHHHPQPERVEEVMIESTTDADEGFHDAPHCSGEPEQLIVLESPASPDPQDDEKHAFLAALTAMVAGRTFTPQELAKELRELRVSEWEIPTLVCVAHNASDLETNRTKTVRMTNLRQTMVYVGLFGFPVEWLDKCELKREQVLDDSIENDVNCLLVYLQTADRRSALHQLTTGEVDLDKCLDWWDQLPPSIDPDPTTLRPPIIEVCGSPGSDYSQTISLYILDAVLIIIAYFIYRLIQIQRKHSVDTISNFPLV